MYKCDAKTHVKKVTQEMEHSCVWALSRWEVDIFIDMPGGLCADI